MIYTSLRLDPRLVRTFFYLDPADTIVIRCASVVEVHDGILDLQRHTAPRCQSCRAYGQRT